MINSLQNRGVAWPFTWEDVPHIGSSILTAVILLWAFILDEIDQLLRSYCGATPTAISGHSTHKLGMSRGREERDPAGWLIQHGRSPLQQRTGKERQSSTAFSLEKNLHMSQAGRDLHRSLLPPWQHRQLRNSPLQSPHVAQSAAESMASAVAGNTASTPSPSSWNFRPLWNWE